MRISLHWVGIGIILLGLQYCANPIAPTGGPRDETPPQLDTAISTPNYQTNFEKQDIELTFDEWIVLKDVFNQVVISPPLNGRPEVGIKKKTVFFEFPEDEVLKEDVTYTINFGEAIEDLTEGNSAENLRFVFSTGDFIDSLSIQGKIVDAKTGEPVEEVLFNMYDNLQDTVVRTLRPFYFAKTGKDGQFRVDNVKSDTFKIFALKDANLNYLFDQSSEPIAFLDTLIILPRDLNQNIELKLFTEEPPLRLEAAQSNTFGVVRLAFSTLVPDLNISTSPDSVELVEEYKNDSLILWYADEQPGRWDLIINYDTLLNDTINVDSLSKDAFLQSRDLRFTEARSTNRPTAISPTGRLEYTMNHPIVSINSDLIVLTADSTNRRVIPTVSIDTSNNKNISMAYPWQEGIFYKLEVLPGAFEDIFGLSLTDTLSQQFRGASRKDFGILNLNVTEMNPDTSYVFDLMSGGTRLVERIVLSGQSEYSRVFENLPPGQYEFHVTIDLNSNGQWDTGNYDSKTQPEPFFIREVDQLRANWEIEANIVVSELE